MERRIGGDRGAPGRPHLAATLGCRQSSAASASDRGALALSKRALPAGESTERVSVAAG
jgi:hypothetical protein